MTEAKIAEFPDPSMESSSSEEQGVTKHKRLQERYNNLEHEWDSIKKSNPRSSHTNSKAMVRSLQYTNNSPRSLMSSLQSSSNKKKPVSTTWKVRTNEMAVDDILRERRAAIESGELKGRSLFEAFEGAIEVHNGNGNGNGLDQDLEEMRLVDYYDSENEDDEYHVWEEKSQSLSPVCCCDCAYCLCSSLKCDNVEDVEEHKSMIVEEIDSSSNNNNNNNKGWWMAFKPCVATCLVLFGIMSVVSFGDYGDGEVNLVPT